jgi:hypothetical protein
VYEKCKSAGHVDSFDNTAGHVDDVYSDLNMKSKSAGHAHAPPDPDPTYANTGRPGKKTAQKRRDDVTQPVESGSASIDGALDR